MIYKIAFLDRDGVINKSNIQSGYIGKIEHFKLIPGAIKTIKYLKSLNYKVVMVSNQSGVARGYFKISDVYKIHQHLNEILKKNNTKLDKILFCPFHIEGKIKKYKKNSKLRKPEIGMFKAINKIWKVDKKKSFIIGDQITDMQFAKKSGIKGYLFKKNNLYKFIKLKKLH
jgi:D-glycero-D-manno-heptose 1,7-bisphosphate phosphatase